MIIFLLINMVLLPCTYIINGIYISNKWINNKNRVGFKFIIEWICVGIFWLIYRLILESYHFIMYLMQGNHDNITEENT